MAKIVVVHDLLDTLPFHDALTWEKYQALCTDVLYKRFNCVDSREYLKKGSKQHGIDVYAVPRGEEKITVAQCKLWEYLGPQQVLDIIAEFLNEKLAGETRQFILCTSADLGRQRDEDATIAAARKILSPLGIELIIWDERGLSKELRTNASAEIINIVYRYFDQAIALKFFGDLWIDHVKKLKKVEKRKYELPEDYIERKVESYTGQVKKEPSGFWYVPDKSQKRLIQLMEENREAANKKIVLLSTAGYGKTEELKNLASYFSAEEKLFYPVKFSLRDYEGQPVDSILLNYSPDWQNIEQENLLLVLDGLDEIGEKYSQTFINQLNAFVEQNPQLKAVVSSRYNFYDVSRPQLRGFDIYLLKPLSYYDIESYLERKLANRVDDFKNLLKERNFSDYNNNPYYLTRLVRFYKEGSNFPKNKSEFFQRVLFERLEKDSTVHNVPDLQEKLLPVAKQIAFCMTVSGKSALTDDEMKIIIPDQETKRLLKLFGILNRNATTLGSWSFEHKNMQEYLCASVLANFSFTQVHNLVSFKFNSNKLVPRFLNTISFLFELIDKDSSLFKELFNWINSNEPELLVRFEKEQLLKSTRNSVFENIYQHYKSHGITIRVSTNFSYEELARFVEIDDKIIEYLQNELKEPLPDSLVYDTIALLEHCHPPYLYKEKLTGVLHGIITAKTYPDSIVASAIRAFANLGFTDQATFKIILKSGIDLENYEMRKSCIFFLTLTQYSETYSQFLVKSIPIIEEGQRRNNVSGSFYSLKQLLTSFKSHKAIKQLLQYCISDIHTIDRHHSYREFHFDLKEVKELLEKATEVYKTDKSILPIVYRLYCSIDYVSLDREWFLPFKLFFENTCGNRAIFEKFYHYDRKKRDIMSFADESCCDFLIEEYKRGTITDGEMTVFRNVLSHVNWSLFHYFYEKLKPLNHGAFLIEDLMVDYDALRAKQEAKNQQMLLNQKLFLTEAETIFNIISKEHIVPGDLWYSENKELRIYQSSLVLETIRELCIHDDDKMITREQFFKKYQNEREWKWFVIETTFSLLKDKKADVLPELLQNLQHWCIHKIETLNFEDSIKDVGNSFRYVPVVEFVKDVFLLLQFDLEDKHLLKMLPSDFESFYGWNDDNSQTISAVAVNKVQDQALLHTTVINNIKRGKLAVMVLCSHFDICHRMKYKECLPDLYETILSHPLLSDHNRVKLTDYYLDLGGEAKDFVKHLEVPFIETEEAAYTSWQWYLLEKLQFNEPNKVASILLEILASDHPEPNKLKAAEHLIQLSRIEGLEYWAYYIREKAVFPFEDKWANLQPYLMNLPVERAIDLFFSVLEFSYQNNIHKKSRISYSIEELLYTSLITLAKAGHQYYTIIKSRIGEMGTRFHSEPLVSSIKFYSERFNQRYYESQKQEVDVQAANVIYLESFTQSL